MPKAQRPKASRGTPPKAGKSPVSVSPLQAEILENVQRVKRGQPGWRAKLPPAVLKDIDDLRARHAAGQIAGTKTALSKSIHDVLEARGMIDVTWKEVARWLAGR